MKKFFVTLILCVAASLCEVAIAQVQPLMVGKVPYSIVCQSNLNDLVTDGEKYFLVVYNANDIADEPVWIKLGNKEEAINSIKMLGLVVAKGMEDNIYETGEGHMIRGNGLIVDDGIYGIYVIQRKYFKRYIKKLSKDGK